MSKFVLIEENIESLKSFLAKEYPQIKSSHLTEAIARGLSFGSNAAMRVFLSKDKTIYNRLFDFNNDTFKNWLSEKSYEGNFEVSDGLFESIFLPPWIFSNKVEMQSVHDKMCSDFNIPSIIIKPMGKKTDIHWDCATLNYEFETQLLDSPYSKSIRELEGKFGSKRALFVPRVFVGTICSVDRENSKLVAAEIFSIISDALNLIIGDLNK